MAADSTADGLGYSIKAVAQATGLSVETLRAWERRYRVIEPRRSGGGHRIYSTADVARLRHLRETTACGHAIGKIAHLSNEELARLSSDLDSQTMQGDAAGLLVARILSSVERYLPLECDQAVAMAFALLPLGQTVRDVLSPALREVGERWHRGAFSIGHERILSSAVRRHMTGLLNTYNALAQGPSVVFATLSGERHELGILMYAALAASQAVRVYYLGADLPAADIGEHANRVGAAAVAISIVRSEGMLRSLRQLSALRRNLAQHVEVWVGGAATSRTPGPKLPAGVVYLAGGRDFEQRVGMLARSSR